MIYQLSVLAAVPGVEEIRVLEWHGTIGSPFSVGDMIVELETHKAVVEVRAGQQGILRDIRAEPGDWVGLEKILAVFSDTADEPTPTDSGMLADLAVEFDVT